jgi:hypothetical protein
MSIQGPGTGISGYSAQFTVGYANSAGNINGYAPLAGQSTYAGYAGSAGNINGYAPLAGQSTYAQTAGNINGYAPAAGSAYSANYATTAQTATYAQSSGYASTAGYAQSAMGSWAWSGQPGTPNWIWGANDAGYYAVWQPANITVGTANYTNGNVGGSAASATNAGYATNADYANRSANATGSTYSQQASNAANVSGGNSVQVGGASGYGAPVYVGNNAGGRNIAQFANGPVQINSNQIRGLYPGASQNITGNDYGGTISIHSVYGIVSSYYVYASDKRAKRDLTDIIEKPQYLDTVEKLDVKKYKWINTIEKGNKLHTGFFAQDVESIIPEVIETSQEFVPTIYGPADITPEKTIKYENHGLIAGDSIKYKQVDDSTSFSNVTSVIDDSEFKLEKDVTGEDIFIMGKHTDDFKTINMDNVVPYTVGAIHELTKRVKVLEDMLNVVSV